MFRLLGFLVGSAASIGAILLLLGVPELELANPELDKARFDEALEKLKAKQRELQLQAPVPQATRVAEPNGTLEATSAAADANAVDGSANSDRLTVSSDTPDTGRLPQPLTEQRWHAFWNPFRSEIAARGFVSQLERVTGLDYRIVKVKKGVYEVSFAYQTDAELDLKLSEIHAATGLDLPPN